MFLFVILGLFVCITEAQGPSAVNPRFEQKGGDVLLTVEADVPEDFILVEWKFNNSIVIVRFLTARKIVAGVYKGRLEFPDEKYSVKLKNLQEADSGVYTARVSDFNNKDLPLAEYTVIVQGAVPRPELTVDSVVSRGSDCHLTVTCTTQDSHINSTFRCDSQTCSQEGGERAEVTTSGSSLHIFLLNSSIICNHSNQVNWTKDVKMTESVCIEPTGSDSPSADGSVCLVKTVLFSVGLVIMVSAVITVHLMEKLKIKPDGSTSHTLEFSSAFNPSLREQRGSVSDPHDPE